MRRVSSNAQQLADLHHAESRREFCSFAEGRPERTTLLGQLSSPGRVAMSRRPVRLPTDGAPVSGFAEPRTSWSFGSVHSRADRTDPTDRQSGTRGHGESNRRRLAALTQRTCVGSHATEKGGTHTVVRTIDSLRAYASDQHGPEARFIRGFAYAKAGITVRFLTDSRRTSCYILLYMCITEFTISILRATGFEP